MITLTIIQQQLLAKALVVCALYVQGNANTILDSNMSIHLKAEAFTVREQCKELNRINNELINKGVFK